MYKKQLFLERGFASGNFQLQHNRAFKLTRKIKCFFLRNVINVMGRECTVLITRREQNYLNYFAWNGKIKDCLYSPHS